MSWRHSLVVSPLIWALASGLRLPVCLELVGSNHTRGHESLWLCLALERMEYSDSYSGKPIGYATES